MINRNSIPNNITVNIIICDSILSINNIYTAYNNNLNLLDSLSNTSGIRPDIYAVFLYKYSLILTTNTYFNLLFNSIFL